MDGDVVCAMCDVWCAMCVVLFPEFVSRRVAWECQATMAFNNFAAIILNCSFNGIIPFMLKLNCKILCFADDKQRRKWKHTILLYFAGILCIITITAAAVSVIIEPCFFAEFCFDLRWVGLAKKKKEKNK